MTRVAVVLVAVCCATAVAVCCAALSIARDADDLMADLEEAERLADERRGR